MDIHFVGNKELVNNNLCKDIILCNYYLLHHKVYKIKEDGKKIHWLVVNNDENMAIHGYSYDVIHYIYCDSKVVDSISISCILNHYKRNVDVDSRIIDEDYDHFVDDDDNNNSLYVDDVNYN